MALMLPLFAAISSGCVYAARSVGTALCHWAIFERLCRATGTSSPRVTDAWLGALAIEHDREWITLTSF